MARRRTSRHSIVMFDQIFAATDRADDTLQDNSGLACRKMERIEFSDLLRQEFKKSIYKEPSQITSRFTGVLPRQFA